MRSTTPTSSDCAVSPSPLLSDMREDNLGDAVVVVYSSAVKPGNAGIRCGASAQAAAGAPRRNARGDHAAQELRRGRGHQRQDHDDHPHCGAARRRRPRPYRRQWRHHQRLRHQRASGRGRVGGGRSRRKRRHVPAAAGVGGGRHQYRPRPSRLFRHVRADARSVSAFRRKRAVLRFCGALPGPSRKCRRWWAVWKTAA